MPRETAPRQFDRQAQPPSVGRFQRHDRLAAGQRVLMKKTQSPFGKMLPDHNQRLGRRSAAVGLDGREIDEMRIGKSPLSPPLDNQSIRVIRGQQALNSHANFLIDSRGARARSKATWRAADGIVCSRDVEDERSRRPGNRCRSEPARCELNWRDGVAGRIGATTN